MLNTKFEQNQTIEDKTRYGWMDIHNIIIPLNFFNAGVNEKKIQKCIDYYNKHNKMDKPISIVGKRLCVNGYSRLVAAQWLYLDKVYVKYITEGENYK